MKLSPQDKNDILELIYELRTHPMELRPVAITQQTECRFFDQHNNAFDGWFIDVQYADGLYEIWFLVCLSGGVCDDTWHIEKIR